MIKIDINEIFEIKDRERLINNFDLMDITFCAGDKPINIDPQVQQEFRKTGLSNIDFIMTNYYLKGMEADKDE